jgi:DNA-binding NtrC family response regulator
MPSQGAVQDSEVLIVDDDDDLRLSLSDVVEALAHRGSLSAGSADEVHRLGPRAVACGLAIIDINLGEGLPSGLDVLADLRRRGFHGRAAFLTGHARSHPDVKRAHEVEGVPVLSKPFDLSELLALIQSAP